MLFGGHRLDARKFGMSALEMLWLCAIQIYYLLTYLLNAAVQLLHVRGAVCQCTVLLEQSRYLTGWHSVYRWQQYDVIMTSWSSIEEVSKRYHQNFLLCNNNEITTCIADIFTSFCEEVYAVEFFKVVRQQTMGKVEIQLYICGQIISVSNSERIIKIGQYLQKLCSYEKWSSFLWLTV